MLSDNAEKAKPSLKKVILRRKNVMFAAPTYIEPSDAEWSTDEEDGLDDHFFDYDDDGNAHAHDDDDHLADGTQDRDHDDDHAAHDNMTIEPLRPRTTTDKEEGAHGKESGKPDLGMFPFLLFCFTPLTFRCMDSMWLTGRYHCRSTSHWRHF